MKANLPLEAITRDKTPLYSVARTYSVSNPNTLPAEQVKPSYLRPGIEGIVALPSPTDALMSLLIRPSLPQNSLVINQPSYSPAVLLPFTASVYGLKLIVDPSIYASQLPGRQPEAFRPATFQQPENITYINQGPYQNRKVA